MRNLQLSALMLIVALMFFQRHAQAQQSKPNAENVQTGNSQAVNAELREKAFTALESLAGQLSTLQSAENRARMGANIADSLWQHNETRARALFLLAQDDIKSRLMVPDNLRDAKEMQTFLVFLKLRSDTLERIVKYDAELAYSFFKATEVDLEKLPDYLVENERSLDLRLSQKLAAKNPEIAVRLARQALARGFSEDHFAVLRRLILKHKEHALVLYKAIVEKLRKTNIKEDWPARQFAGALARAFQPPTIDELAFRDLVGFLVMTAAANGCEGKPSEDEQNEFCSWTASTLANVEKIDPRVGRLKRWTREVDEPDPRPDALLELDELVEEGTVDDVLALAGKYPDFVDEIYWRALMKARGAGDLDQMRKIANEFKGSPERRQAMVETVAQAERSASVSEERLAEIQARLDEIPQLQDRVWMLMSSAYRVGQSNRKMALKMLNQATQIVEMMSPGKEQADNQIALAMMYCLEKDDRGFTIMESLVPKLNSLIDAAVKLDGYDTSYLREGEWNMSAAGQLGELLTRLSQGAQLFAWSDFDRAMSLAAQFERAEIRMMAQLKLAQSILAGPHKRSLIH